MLILGINAWHPDAAACLVHDGRILAAAEEERFVREKHHAGFPAAAIRFCMEQAGVGAGELDAVAVNSDPAANRCRRALFALRHPSAWGVLRERLRARSRRAGVLARIAECLQQGVPRARLLHIEHHRAHLASAFFCSGFESAAAASVDGFGDFASAAFGSGEGDTLRVHQRVLFPHSLGIFYQALTQFLGFHAYGDEYKVMGLASYGEPRFMEPMRRLLRLHGEGRFALDLRYFRHHRLRLGLDGSQSAPRFPPLFHRRVASLLGPPRAPGSPVEQRHRDLAHSVQKRYEQGLGHLLQHVAARTGHHRLALAGGCAMNSVANGRVPAEAGFGSLFVQPAAGDAGGALGAALCAERDVTGRLPRHAMRSAALGPCFDDDTIARTLDGFEDAFRAQRCERYMARDDDTLCRDTAVAIAAGAVVGWFQGRMEWGPRALGQRSILADPRRRDVRELLNAKIKRREAFRPFAPSILREAVAEWFSVDDDVPFMMKVYPVREDRRAQVPAITHVDGSGRPQTVTREANGLYHALISAFARETGVPMLLNTSFNENEPIVCRPEEAIDCFLRTRMDRLVLGRHVVIRNG